MKPSDGIRTRKWVRQRGTTLVFALSLTLIAAIIMGVLGTFVLVNLNKATVDSDYAAALNLAEAGINYELRWISQDTNDPNRPHQLNPAESQNGPYTGAIQGVDGTFTVYVTKYDESDPDGPGTSPWSAPDDMLITATGTVNGITRAVRIRGIRKSLFDEYALYAIDDGTFSGGGAAEGSTRIWGNLGSNGSLTFNGGLQTDIIDGEVELNGPNASSSDGGENVNTNPDSVDWPSIPDIANAMWSGGLTHLASNNSNANILELSGSDNAMTNHTAIEGLTLADLGLIEEDDPNALNPATKRYVPSGSPHAMFQSAGFSASDRLFDDPPNSTDSATSDLDDGATGSRYVTRQISVDANGDISLFLPPIEGIKSLRTYFLPPGDYYFGRVDWKSGNTAFVVLNHLGPVRIWVDTVSGYSQDDSLGSVVVFTSTDPSKFRLFYNKCATLTITGNSTFYGSFYANRTNCAKKGVPDMKFTGNSTVYGSVISNFFTVSGGTQVIFPNDGGGADPTDYSLWFGFKDGWRELPIPGSTGPVFKDGTNN